MVYLAKMVNGFIFYDVVRCWCLFPGTALWDWVLNSGLVEKLPSASCQVFSSLNDFIAAMFLVLLAMMWLGVAFARGLRSKSVNQVPKPRFQLVCFMPRQEG